MEKLITCPSGLTGKVRGLRVREERILADRQLAKSGEQTDALLKACWVETVDAGLYGTQDEALPWSAILTGDRFYALLQVRIATYGPAYAFSIPCQSCRAKVDWEIDLAQLPVKGLPDESRAAFANGNRFETRLPGSDQKVWFKLLVGGDEHRLPQLRRAAPDRVMSSLLAYRVLEVEGVDARDKRRFLEDLSLADATALFRLFDVVDCGIDTQIEIACPECGAEQEVELPLGQQFFLPTKGRRSAPSPA
jgi:hypothetical protein